MLTERTNPTADENELEDSLDSQTVALRWIAGLLIAGAAWLLAPILVPFVVALSLAIAVSPLADRLERIGLGRTASSLACLGLVAGVLIATACLLAYQAGSILQKSDRYLDRLSRMLATTTSAVGGERLLTSLGAIKSESPQAAARTAQGENTAPSESSEPGTAAADNQKTPADPVAFWAGFLRNNLRLLSGWLISGLGGLVGFIGSMVIVLSFLFYLMDTRAELVNRMLRVLFSLGMRPRRDCLGRVQSEITTFAGFVSMVSICGAFITGTTAWLLGVPQPFLWGLVFGLLEFVPYFGPMVGGTLLTLVAMTTGSGSWWQPLVMGGVILGWLTLEGYVITPMIYGRAVRFDPVTVLVAILFFGWLWGPLGMVTALPVMVLLRELVVMSPETPALDALMEPSPTHTPAPAVAASGNSH
jgi:predicted PurR-regulated permease PerM